MKKLVSLIFFAIFWLSFAHAQTEVTSPSATEFVRYGRIPVSYFNGLPKVDVPLYTIECKDLQLPISLSYYASGVKLNQRPTYVGLGWNLNAGGAIVRVINEMQDETTADDLAEMGLRPSLDPGYYFSSGILDRDDWSSESMMIYYQNLLVPLDSEPDEFVINAYGVSGSVYFYRDRDGKLRNKVKTNNGELFRVEDPVFVQEPQNIVFRGGGPGNDLKAYRIHTMPYEFTVVKNDGTKLIFGGDFDCIEFYTKKVSGANNSYLRTIPSTWMLRELISPKGEKISFIYARAGSPVIMSDVISDCAVYEKDGDIDLPPLTSDRGKSFIVQHPLYPLNISTEGGLTVDFITSKTTDMPTVNKSDSLYLRIFGFDNRIVDNVTYGGGIGYNIDYEPHNYSNKLSKIVVRYKGQILKNFNFGYFENKDSRLKLSKIAVTGINGIAEQAFNFQYNAVRLPEYNTTETDNWGYWNGRNYRNSQTELDAFFEFRTPDEKLTKAEVLTDIHYPTGGSVSFEYELNDYSKVATQVPDFKIKSISGKAGGLRIKEIRYNSDSTSYVHRFKYESKDGSSSGILSGIPRYIAHGRQHFSYKYSFWEGMMHFREKNDINHKYLIYSENYVNMLGLTTGNHVTYSRVVESVGDKDPLVKEYTYTNHDTHPDTSDFAMYTNMDEVSLDNKFTSKALERGLLEKEVWYNAGKPVKDIKYIYNFDQKKYENCVRCIEKFRVDGAYNPFDMVRYTPYKVLTFYPNIDSRTETLYSTNDGTVISTITEKYQYNDNLLVEKVVMNDSKGKSLTTDVTYPDACSGDIYKEMISRGIVSSPVEVVKYRNGQVIEGKLTEYKLEHNIVTPYRHWKLGISEGLDSVAFVKYSQSEERKDLRYELDEEKLNIDSSGNPLSVKNINGLTTSYLWGYSSLYPTISVANAEQTFCEHLTYVPTGESINIYLDPNDSHANQRTYNITTGANGNARLQLYGALGYDWFVSGKIAGRDFNLVQIRSSLPLEEPWNRYLKAFGNEVIVNGINKGEYKLVIEEVKCRRGYGGGDLDKGVMQCSYVGESVQVDSTGKNDVFYESFETFDNSSILPFGYHSDKCYVGAYKVTLRGQSDSENILDYRVYRGGRWEYVCRTMKNRVEVIDEALNPIDEIRVYPSVSNVESYTWYPHIGLRSRTDGCGITESYIYDVFGRLQSVCDNDGNVIRQYLYNYAGNKPSIYPLVYANESISVPFRSSKCDTTHSYLPIPIAYTVPSNRYYSKISQSDANRMAYEDVLENGQKFADENGRCEANVVIQVYNPTQFRLSVRFTWGVLGNYQYGNLPVEPGERIADTGDIRKDFKPTEIRVPRIDYKSIVIFDYDNNKFDFKADSGYDAVFPYLENNDYMDVYIINSL